MSSEDFMRVEMIWWIIVPLLAILIYIVIEFHFWLDSTRMRSRVISDFEARRRHDVCVEVVEAMSDDEIITVLNQHMDIIFRLAYKDATIYYTPPESIPLVVWGNRLKAWVEAIEDMKGMNANHPDYEYYFERYNEFRDHAKAWILNPYYANLRPHLGLTGEWN